MSDRLSCGGRNGSVEVFILTALTAAAAAQAADGETGQQQSQHQSACHRPPSRNAEGRPDASRSALAVQPGLYLAGFVDVVVVVVLLEAVLPLPQPTVIAAKPNINASASNFFIVISSGK
jgi:hypothetical protein